jgi:thiol-disulfide isomerase/thioredoxin
MIAHVGPDRRSACCLTILMALVGLAGVALAGSGPDAFRALAVVTLASPRTAPAFSLSTSGGPLMRLTDYRGHVVFLNFWATWCPPCREELPAIERLYRRHKDGGLMVLAVSIDAEGAAVVAPFVAEQQLS